MADDPQMFVPATTPMTRVTDPYSVTSKVKPQPEEIAAAQAQAQSYNDEAAAIQPLAEAQAKVAEEQAREYALQAEREAGLMRERQRVADEYRSRLEDERSRSDFRMATAMRTPTTFWQDRSDDEKSEARLAVFLSAIGSAISGGENQAIKYFETQIERDARAKQAQAERYIRLAEQSRGALADLYRERADYLGDIDAQRAAGWQLLQKRAEAMNRTLVPQQLRAEGAQKIAQIGQKAAEAELRRAEGLRQKVDVHGQQRVVETPTSGGVKDMPGVLYDANGRPVAAIPNVGGAAAQKLGIDRNAAIAEWRSIDGLLAQLDASFSNDGREAPTTKSAQMRAAIGNVVTVKLKNLEKLGVLSKDDREILERQVKADYGWTDLANPATRLRTSRAAFRDQIEKDIIALGIGREDVDKIMASPTAQTAMPATRAIPSQPVKPPSDERRKATLKNGTKVWVFPDGTYEERK